jgi:hypothetical protein
MTSLSWKRSRYGSDFLSHWELQVVLVEWFDGTWSFTVTSPLDGVRWGPRFATEVAARRSAEAAFLRSCDAHDWASITKARTEEIAAETPPPCDAKKRPSPALRALEEAFRQK